MRSKSGILIGIGIAALTGCALLYFVGDQNPIAGLTSAIQPKPQTPLKV